MTNARANRQSGYTLIEMLLVLGIVLLLTTLALISASSMLRSTRMNRALNLFVTAADEARATALTFRRTSTVDVSPLNAIGDLNRLSVSGPALNDDFEGYSPAPLIDATLQTHWLTSNSTKAQVIVDRTQCLQMLSTPADAAGQYYWSPGYRTESARREDYEMLLHARVKFASYGSRTVDRYIGLLGCISDSGATVNQAYRLMLQIVVNPGPYDPVINPPGRNLSSQISIDRVSGALAAGTQVIDILGGPSPSSRVTEGVWYQVLFSIKEVTTPGSATSTVTLAGKVWTDGELEPSQYTVGPVIDANPLPCGFGGFYLRGNDAFADDVSFDFRPIHDFPAGLRIDTFAPLAGVANPTTPADYALALPYTNYSFPILFRPDGTAPVKSIIRISDMTSGDSRYMIISPNTGRARLVHDFTEATAP